MLARLRGSLLTWYGSSSNQKSDAGSLLGAADLYQCSVAIAGVIIHIKTQVKQQPIPRPNLSTSAQPGWCLQPHSVPVPTCTISARLYPRARFSALWYYPVCCFFFLTF